MEQNLCVLLGIDVEALALKLANGINPWDDGDELEEQACAEKTDITCTKTNSSKGKM